MSDDRHGAVLKPALKAALEAVAQSLANLPAPGMLIGGMAVIAHGVARLTRDVDLTVAGSSISLDALLEYLRPHNLQPRIDHAIEFALANQVLLLRHQPSGIDVDLSIAWLPFELEALAAATLVDIAGIRLRVARPEDLIVYKAVAFRPQDQQDIERLLVLYGRDIDLARIRRVITEFAALLEEPERPAAFERLVHRAGVE